MTGLDLIKKIFQLPLSLSCLLTRAKGERMFVSLSGWQAPSLKSWTRIIALSISLSFIFPFLSWAFEPGVFPRPANQFEFNHQLIDIQQSLGAITKVYKGGKHLVVHVQDLHCNYEVQNNIAKLIDELAGRQGLRLVGVEGAYDRINVSKLSSFPIAVVKKNIAHYLMQQGKITGPELYAATGQHAIHLEGIESRELYEKNRKTVMEFLNNETQGYIFDLREGLNALKAGVYNRELRKFDEKQQAFRRGEMTLLKYSVFIHSRARSSKENLQACPNLSAYVSRREQILSRTVASDGLFRELERLDQRLRAGLYTTPEQEEMDVLQHRLDVMEKLLNISASPEELAEYRGKTQEFRIKRFLEYMARHDKKRGYMPDVEVFRLDENLRKAEEFYQVADQRSLVFVKNVIERMKRGQADIAMLVTGGFHTDIMLAELERKGVSYICVKPRLRRQDIVNPYFALLRGQRTPLEKLMAQNQNILSLATVWPQGTNPAPPDPADFKVMDVLMVMGSLVEGVKAGISSRLKMQRYYNKLMTEYVFHNKNIGPIWDRVRMDSRCLAAPLTTGFAAIIQQIRNAELFGRPLASLRCGKYMASILPEVPEKVLQSPKPAAAWLRVLKWPGQAPARVYVTYWGAWGWLAWSSVWMAEKLLGLDSGAEAGLAVMALTFSAPDDRPEEAKQHLDMDLVDMLIMICGYLDVKIETGGEAFFNEEIKVGQIKRLCKGTIEDKKIEKLMGELEKREYIESNKKGHRNLTKQVRKMAKSLADPIQEVFETIIDDVGSDYQDIYTGLFLTDKDEKEREQEIIKAVINGMIEILINQDKDTSRIMEASIIRNRIKEANLDNENVEKYVKAVLDQAAGTIDDHQAYRTVRMTIRGEELIKLCDEISGKIEQAIDEKVEDENRELKQELLHPDFIRELLEIGLYGLLNSEINREYFTKRKNALRSEMKWGALQRLSPDNYHKLPESWEEIYIEAVEQIAEEKKKNTNAQITLLSVPVLLAGLVILGIALSRMDVILDAAPAVGLALGYGLWPGAQSLADMPLDHLPPLLAIIPVLFAGKIKLKPPKPFTQKQPGKSRDFGKPIRAIQMIAENLIEKKLEPNAENISKTMRDIVPRNFEERKLFIGKSWPDVRLALMRKLESGVEHVEAEIKIQKAYQEAEDRQVSWAGQIKKSENNPEETVFIVDPEKLPEALEYYYFNAENRRILVVRSNSADDVYGAERYAYWIEEINKGNGYWPRLGNTREIRRVAELLTKADYVLRGRSSTTEKDNPRIAEILNEFKKQEVSLYLCDLVARYIGEGKKEILRTLMSPKDTKVTKNNSGGLRYKSPSRKAKPEAIAKIDDFLEGASPKDAEWAVISDICSLIENSNKLGFSRRYLGRKRKPTHLERLHSSTNRFLILERLVEKGILKAGPISSYNFNTYEEKKHFIDKVQEIENAIGKDHSNRNTAAANLLTILNVMALGPAAAGLIKNHIKLPAWLQKPRIFKDDHTLISSQTLGMIAAMGGIFLVIFYLALACLSNGGAGPGLAFLSNSIPEHMPSIPALLIALLPGLALAIKMPDLSEPVREEIYNHAITKAGVNNGKQKSIIIWEIINDLLKTKIEGYEEGWLKEAEKHEGLKEILRSEIEQIVEQMAKKDEIPKRERIGKELIRKIVNFYFLSDKLDRMTLMVLKENLEIKSGASVLGKIKARTADDKSGSMRSPVKKNMISWKLLEHLNLIETGGIGNTAKFEKIYPEKIEAFLEKRGVQWRKGEPDKNQPADKRIDHGLRMKIIQIIAEECRSKSMKPTQENIMEIVDNINKNDFEMRGMEKKKNAWDVKEKIQKGLKVDVGDKVEEIVGEFTEAGMIRDVVKEIVEKIVVKEIVREGVGREIEKEIQIQEAYQKAEDMEAEWSKRKPAKTDEENICVYAPGELPDPLRHYAFKHDNKWIAVVRSQADDDIYCAVRYAHWIEQLGRETGSWAPLKNTREKRRVAEILALEEYIVRKLSYRDENGKLSLCEIEKIQDIETAEKDRIKNALDELGETKMVRYVYSLARKYLPEEKKDIYIKIAEKDKFKNKKAFKIRKALNSHDAASANLLLILSILAVGPAAVGLIRRPGNIKDRILTLVYLLVVYIVNTIKVQPEDSDSPESEKIQALDKYLKTTSYNEIQWEIVKLIAAIGAGDRRNSIVSRRYLLDKEGNQKRTEVYKVLKDITNKGVLSAPGSLTNYSFIEVEEMKEHFLAKVDEINKEKEKEKGAMKGNEAGLWEKFILLPVLLIPMFLIYAGVLANGESVWLSGQLAAGWDYWGSFAAAAMLLSGIVMKSDGDAAPGENGNIYEKIKKTKPGKNLIKNIAKACGGDKQTIYYIQPVIKNLAQLKPYDDLKKTIKTKYLKNDPARWELFLDAMETNVVFRHMVEHLDGMAENDSLQRSSGKVFTGNGNKLTEKIEKMYWGKFEEEIPEEYSNHLTKLAIAEIQEPIPDGMALNDRNKGVMRLIESKIQERYQCYIEWKSELQIMASQRGLLGRDGMRELIIELKGKKHEAYLGRIILTDPVADILLRKLDELQKEEGVLESGNAGQERWGEGGETVAPLNTPLLQLLGPGLRIFSGLHASMMLIRAGILAGLPTAQRQENIAAKANADSDLKALLRYHFFRIPAELVNNFKTDNISLGMLDNREFAWHTRMKARFLGHYTDEAGIVVYIPQSILAILLPGQPGPKSNRIYRLRYNLAHALFTSMAAYQGGRYRHKTISGGLNLARQVNRVDFLRHSFIANWLNRNALRLNREAYLMERFKHDGRQYGSFFRSLLEYPNSDLSKIVRNKNITSIPEFQNQMIMILIDVLRDHEADLSLLQDVIRFMNYVTPGAVRIAGKINGKPFRMPNIIDDRSMQGLKGFIMDYFYRFPGEIIIDLESPNNIPRRIIQFAEQAA